MIYQMSPLWRICSLSSELANNSHWIWDDNVNLKKAFKFRKYSFNVRIHRQTIFLLWRYAKRPHLKSSLIKLFYAIMKVSFDALFSYSLIH